MEIVNGTEITYLYAEGQPFALHKKNVNESTCINYLHLDYQGSMMAITNQSGTLLEERNGVYPERSRRNVWGRPRKANTLEYVLPNPAGSVLQTRMYETIQINNIAVYNECFRMYN